MANRVWLAAAFGLLCVTQAQAQERPVVHGPPSRQIEVSEAFPWDEPVEQTFTAESVLRWRRAMAAEGQQQVQDGAGRHQKRY